MKLVAGIDVGKAHLDVSVSAGPVRRFDNSGDGITSLLCWLKRHAVTLSLCEPTGGYERLLVSRFAAAGLALHLVHPNKLRAFARACGHHAKTDALDAQLLSRFGELFALSDSPEPDPDRAELQAWLGRRRQLLEERLREINRLHKGLSDGVRDSTKRHIAWLDEELKHLDDQYRQTLLNNHSLAQQVALYRSVRGVGELTAAILAAYLPELGHCGAKPLTALVGLAPWSRDSGRSRGYRAIRGGRGVVRRALYMAALSNIRHHGNLRSFYDRLRERGKPGKVALVAVMRKLLLQLNAVARRGTPWLDQHAPAT